VDRRGFLKQVGGAAVATAAAAADLKQQELAWWMTAQAMRTVDGNPASGLAVPFAARQSLIGFSQYTMPVYRAEPVHRLIAGTLDRVVTGEIRRLMIWAPPQHGKSQLTSVNLPAYWLGKRPDDPVVLTSYGASLAEEKSEMAREIIRSDDYRALFPGIELKNDTQAKALWKIQGRRGQMVAAGAGGPITGRGGLLGLIDDPFKDWEEAQSKTVRKRIWDWYRGTFRSRMWEGSSIVIIMTRWHKEDLCGMLLQEQPEKWTVLRLPAIAETQEERDSLHESMNLPTGLSDPLGRAPGEVLSPLRFSKAAILEFREDMGGFIFNAEYQGAPRSAEGNIFKEAWFAGCFVDEVPRECNRIRYWDKAGTADAGCHTVGLLYARDEFGLFYVEDVVRGQWSSFERNKVMLETAKLDAMKYGNTVDIWVEQEPGSGGKESAEISLRMLARFPVHKDPVSTGKEVRIRPVAAQFEAGNVKVKRARWNKAFVSELLEWTEEAAEKDQGDALSGAHNKVVLDTVESESAKGALAQAIGWRGRGRRR
jgi:predicted phage terminase large subunit-like protein